MSMPCGKAEGSSERVVSAAVHSVFVSRLEFSVTVPLVMMRQCIVLSLLVLLATTTVHGKRKSPRKGKSNYFDVLIFTQNWPQTVCYKWKEKSDSNTCDLPRDDEWTIHGIWPSKYNTLEPQFCNSSMPFDPAALKSIEPELKVKWRDIMTGRQPYQFWRHEWEKHGTCAVTLERFNTEKKYFLRGIELLDMYDMKHVLAKANILPGGSYTVEDFFIGIQKVLGTRSMISCVQNLETGISYLSEIRICFDKSLQLIDCDGIVGYPTDCDRSEEIVYPGKVPRTYSAIQI